MTTLHSELLNKLFYIMPKLIVVLLNWTLNTQLKMISLALNVVTFMGNNVGTFATPTVVLTVLKAAADRLQAAYDDRLNGDEARIEYENAGIALDILLHNQAIYVNGIAKGDSSIIAKAGYKASSGSKTPKVKCVAPDAAKLGTNAGGGLKITLINKVAGATSYIFVVFFGAVGTIIVGKNYVKPSIEAIVITNGKLSESLSGIPAGTTATVIAFAQNSAGISPAGPSVSVLVN